MADGATGSEALEWGERPEEAAGAEASAEAVGRRLAEARRKAGMTGRELGAAVGLRPDQISKIESGKRRLDIGELPRVAAALGVTVRYLVGQPERQALAMASRLVTGAPPSANQAARRRARQLVELDDLLTQVAGLTAACPSTAGANLLRRVRDEYSDVPRSRQVAQAQGRELAELARRELDLGSDALGDLATLIEQHFAVDVALSPMGTDVDGLCVHCGDAALILASSSFSDGHLRFTLAHELGHHLLGDPRLIIEESEGDMFGGAVAERRVNAFAAHLLMPERGIRSVLDWLGESSGPISDRAVVALMEHFGVSLAALVHQLTHLGVLGREEGGRLRERNSVRALVTRHRDVAPTSAAGAVRETRRAPERLTRHALDAVRLQRLGLSVVAALLEVEDDERLWNDIMGDVTVQAEADDVVL